MASCCTSRVYRLSRCNHPCRPARGRRRRAGRASPRQSPARGAPDAVPRSGAALDSYTAGFGSESDSGLPNVPSREADGLTDRRPQPGRMARLDGDQRGQRHQLVAAAGHRHHRGAAAAAPGAALWAALSPSRIRPRRPARRPGPPPSFTTGQASSRHAAIRSSSRSAARRAGTYTLQPIRCSSTSIPASVYSTPNPLPDLLGDPGQGPALIGIPAGRRARVQDRLQLAQLRPGELALRAARPLGGQRRPAARRQRAAPPVRRHPRYPEPLRYLLIAGPGLDQLRRLQPHLLPASPFRRGQPAAVGISHDPGIPHPAPPDQTQ
jgi:hypothetical protein